MAGPLDGIRVLDLGRYQAGPRGAMVLSDLGAEVIKVEAPGGEEAREQGPLHQGQSIYWSVYNRGKKSITLNLRHEKGRGVLRELVRHADMFLQNFRPGVIQEMGFGYEALRELSPGIIMINVSGFGQYGPYKHRPAFDPIGQAMSGLMSLTGFPEGPPIRTYSPIIDRITALHATIGALAALHHREKTGQGQAIDVCLLDAALTLVEIPLAHHILNGAVPEREGNRSGMGGAAPSNTFQAKDGWVYITAVAREMWGRFCRTIGRPDMTTDPRFATRMGRRDNVEYIEQVVAEWVQDKTVEEVMSILEKAEVPVGPVNTIPQVAKDPHVWERQMMVEVEDPIAGKMLVPGLTIKFSETPGKLARIPQPGEHNEEIYCGLLGHSQAELARWKEEGVI